MTVPQDIRLKRLTWFLILALLGMAETAGANPILAAKVRHASFAVRDMPPSPDEAKRYLAGEVTLQALVDSWMATEEHKTKVKRFFYDMFGTQDFGITSAGHVELRKNAAGIYKLDDKADCDAGGASDVSAWWLEPGQKVKVCQSSLSDEVAFGTRGQPGYVSCAGHGGMPDPRCGCGPDLALCIPEDLLPTTNRASYTEFEDRGLYMYEQGRSWKDLFASNLFFGNRTLYYLYLWHGWMSPYGEAPSSTDLARLKSLPVATKGLTELPEKGAIRAPVVTGVNFMVQYNNFRSRIRALSERMLCQPVTGALNTSGIATFLNEDLTEADLAHGKKDGCASCHYPMDNMGSMLLGWSDLGFYDSGAELSQVGHVFGQDGVGPLDLMRGIVERAPTFHSCMARRAWETFAGLPWGELSSADRGALEALATEGPRPLIQGVLKKGTQ